jgi:hypothetical protein
VLAEEISLHPANQPLARRQPLHSRATLMSPTLPVQLLHNMPCLLLLLLLQRLLR